MIILTHYTIDTKTKRVIIPKHQFICPTCRQSILKHYDYRKRTYRLEGGDKNFCFIPRERCQNPACRTTHNCIPNLIVPYKHYTTEVISGVLDEIITTDDEFNVICPSEWTMQRWKAWYTQAEINLTASLSPKYQTKDLTLFKSGHPDWLEFFLPFIFR